MDKKGIEMKPVQIGTPYHQQIYKVSHEQLDPIANQIREQVLLVIREAINNRPQLDNVWLDHAIYYQQQ
jgi:hypothetical protein